MTELEEVMAWVNLALFPLLAAICLRIWFQRRSSAARWMAAAFGSLGGVVLVARFLPEDPEDQILWVTKLLVLAILLFPYALYRFAGSFSARPVWRRRICDSSSALLAVATLALPDFPGPEEPQPTYIRVYTIAIVLWWLALAVITAYLLWRGGNGQPTLARRRMRLLAAASVLLALAIVPSVQPAEDRPDAVIYITAVLPSLSALLFYFGFAPPGVVRLLWRRPEQAALRRAELNIMQAHSPTDVAELLLPHVARVLGGRAAVLVRASGDVLGAYGVDTAHAEAIADDAIAGRADENVVSFPMRDGCMVVVASNYTPFFGDEEIGLLTGLATFTDLALDRARLLEGERQAREAIEAANAELETLVYGISHDLKSPIITLVGYLEYLQADYADKLDEEAQHYIRRMAASAHYMEDLLQDLLELSRIGRVQTETEEVDLPRIAAEVASSPTVTEGGARVEVGPLPQLAANPVRVRQLLTNLVENAVRHGGKEDLTVRIASERSADGGVAVTVADNGVGIAPQYREKVFGIFERLEHSGNSGKGTGIGLALCRKIMESMGGRITIDDVEVGTCFRLEFPAAAVRSARRERVEVGG